MAYQFTPAHPPLLKDNDGDIFDIDPMVLQKSIGEAHWDTSTPASGSVPANTKEFLMTRKWVWGRIEFPKHYANDETFKVTRVQRFKATDKSSMERVLGIDADADFFDSLKLSVKTSLKYTTEQTHEWSVDNTVEHDFTFKAGYTYCDWVLYDLLEATATTTTVVGTDKNQTTTIASLPYVIAYYNDFASDEQIAASEGGQRAPKLFKSEEQFGNLISALPAYSDELGVRWASSEAV